MTVFEIFESLEQTNSSTVKIDILKKNCQDSQLTTLLDMALGFKHKFFIVKFNDYIGYPEGSGQSHNAFMALLNRLKNREITGDAAKHTVESFFASCTNTQRTWYSRIVRKDLKCGVNLGTTDKAGIDIEKFEVMLAKDGKGNKKVKELVAKGGLASPKFDGYRCLTIISNGVVEMYSRNGSLYSNFPTIEKELTELFPTGDYVFDGEIMSDSFQAMQKSAFSVKSKETCGDIVYYLFDQIPFDEWINQDFIINKIYRYEMLQKTFNGLNNKQVRLVSQTYTDSVAEILKMEQEYLLQGYEGAMWVPNCPYYLGKKSNKMLKFKTMLSQDCTVTGFIEGTGKYINMLGALIVRQENGETCEVGTGFTDADREYIWQNKEEIINKISEIKYQELSADGIMRFPVFMRWRSDK